MFDYKLLEDSVKNSDVLKDFRMVNKQIDVMLLNDDDKIEKIKALICYYEGKLNKSNTYTVLAISFALIIGAISVVLNYFGENDKIFLIGYFLLIVSAFFIVINSKDILKGDYKKTFILKVLYFKLEEFSKDVQNQELETVLNLKKHIIRIRRK